jgi:AbrB family looped-hinge helix DNA binding protein
MKQVSSTSMSSRGQVVIPEEVRKTLNLQEGDKFLVFCDKDVVILKVLTPPSIEEFDELIKKARKEAKKAGLKKSDIKKAILQSRKK